MGGNGKLWIVVLLLLVFTAFALPALCGELDSPAHPTGSPMWTLEDIYKALQGDRTVQKRSGPFREPTSGPGSTGHTLNDIMEMVPPSPAPKPTGSPSDEHGVSWPTPRFTINGDGTVTDNLTGLIWLRDTRCPIFFDGDTTGKNRRRWPAALTAANSLADGYCGLSDGSAPGDWRLPNVEEMYSLYDFAYDAPALSNAQGDGQWTEGDAFYHFGPGCPYWTSTTAPGAVVTGSEVAVYWMCFDTFCGYIGRLTGDCDACAFYVWPVRGGQ